jgi:hypothetical protein
MELAPFIRATFDGLVGRMGGAAVAVERLSRMACLRPLSLWLSCRVRAATSRVSCCLILRRLGGEIETDATYLGRPIGISEPNSSPRCQWYPAPSPRPQ